MTLVATPGSSTANTYATLQEAKLYCTNNLYTAEWDAATDSQRESALIMATRLLDADKWPWKGSAASATQALCWPRSGMTGRTGFPIQSDVLPQELKDAVSEFAKQLVASDRTGDNDPVRQGITSVKAGSVSISFDPKSTTKEEASWIIIPDVVRMMIQIWKELTYEEQILKNKTEMVFESL